MYLNIDCYNSNNFTFQVSSKNRPVEIQQLIDKSFKIRVLPLHQKMFEGKWISYVYWGQNEDYKFNDSKWSAAGIKASEIAQEFASKKEFAVLDLGCGVGTFLKSLKEKFSNVKVMGVTAADFRPTEYNSQELYLPDQEYIIANIENLNQVQALKGKKFDFIVSSFTFMHLSDPLGVLCQAYDLLNENGILLVDKFSLNGISSKKYLKAIKEAGCKDFEILTETSSLDQTKIRKVGLEHLCLPIYYDLSKSTKPSDLRKARIFYTQDMEKVSCKTSDKHGNTQGVEKVTNQENIICIPDVKRARNSKSYFLALGIFLVIGCLFASTFAVSKE